MFHSNILDSKVVHHECELHWSTIVCPKTGDLLALLLSSLVEYFSRISLSNKPAYGKLYMRRLALIYTDPFLSAMSLSLYSLMIATGMYLMP